MRYQSDHRDARWTLIGILSIGVGFLPPSLAVAGDSLAEAECEQGSLDGCRRAISAYLEWGEYEKAIRWYEAGLILTNSEGAEADTWTRVVLLGDLRNAHAQVGDYSAAIETGREQLASIERMMAPLSREADPLAHDVTLNELCKSNMELGRLSQYAGDLDGAITLFLRAREVNASDVKPESHVASAISEHLVALFMATGDRERALAELRDVVDNPAFLDSEGQLDLPEIGTIGGLLHPRGEKDTRRILPTLVLIGWLQHQEGNEAESQQWFERASRLYPSDEIGWTIELDLELPLVPDARPASSQDKGQVADRALDALAWELGQGDAYGNRLEVYLEYARICSDGSLPACYPHLWQVRGLPQERANKELRKRARYVFEPYCRAGDQPACTVADWLNPELDGARLDDPGSDSRTDIEWGATPATPELVAGCGRRDAMSCIRLAVKAADGDEMEPQKEVAVTLLLEACLNSEALGACLEAGGTHRALFRDDGWRTTAFLFGQGCENGHGRSCKVLADQLWSQPRRTCFERSFSFQEHACDLRPVPIWERACELSEAWGCHRAGEAYVEGDGVEKDHARARNLEDAGCEMGHVDSCVLAGNLHRWDGNHPTAFARYERGCELDRYGPHEGCVGAAELLRDGDGVPPDPRRALGLMDLACEHDSRRGCVECGKMHLSAGNDERAFPCWSRFLELHEPYRYEDPTPYAVALSNLGLLHYERGEAEQSIERGRQALEIWEQENDPDAPIIARALTNLGLTHHNLGDHHAAVPLLRRALEIRQRIHPEDAPEVAAAMGDVGAALVGVGEYAEALPMLQRAMARRPEGSGCEGDTLSGWINLANAHMRLAEYDAALRVLEEEAFPLAEACGGPVSQESAIVQMVLGTVLSQRGDLDDAMDALNRAIEVGGSPGVADDDVVAQATHTLSICLITLGDTAGATELVEGQDIDGSGTGGPPDFILGSQLNTRGNLAQARGDFEEAERLFLRAHEIFTDTRGPSHPDTMLATNNLAVLYADVGRLEEALPLFEAYLTFLEQTRGADHPDTGLARNNLGRMYQARGDHETAREMFEQALASIEEGRGPDHPEAATVLTNLAGLHLDRGEVDDARRRGQRALDIFRGEDLATHWGTAAALTVLGQVFQADGDYDTAFEAHEQALRVVGQLRGEEHPEVAAALNNMALCAQQTGDLEGADDLLQQAADLLVRTKGDRAPDLAPVLQNRGLLAAHTGGPLDAVPLLARSAEVEDVHLARSLAISSPEEIGTLLEHLSIGADAVVSLHVDRWPDSDEAARLALRTVVRRKGASVDAGVDTRRRIRRGLDDDTLQLLEQLEERLARIEAARRSGASSETLSEARGGSSAAVAEIAELETRLARRTSHIGATLEPAELAQVAASLPEGGALLEWVVFAHIDPDPAALLPRSGFPRYAAYVLRKDGTVEGLHVGSVVTLDGAAENLRTALTRGVDPSGAAEEAYRAIWAPVAGMLEGVSHVVIAPDGELALLPWDVLLGEDGRYLAQRHLITTVTSGRDLLARPDESTKPGPPVVVAAVEFGESAGSAQVSHVGTCSGPWKPLPGTAEEGERIVSLLPGSDLRTGFHASESFLKGTDSPLVLHVATHGCFEGDSPPSEDGAGRGASRLPTENRVGGIRYGTVADLFGLPQAPRKDSLFRSGIVLAGANGDPGRLDNGFLSAAEIAQLDLRGTELAVLSACETGVGDVRVGDGVHGLRRALVLAGARTQVLSLWKVDDAATADLMVAFYDRLLAGEPRGEALRQAKLEMLRSTDRAHPRYWASFVLSGAWEPMEFQAP